MFDRRMTGVAAVLTVLALTSWAWSQDAPPAAEAAPEIGRSVQFAGVEGGSLSLADLRGKLVVVVYFQSWCGICNGWSPRLFNQIEEAAGDRRDVVLLAVKTDGGRLVDAARYLKTRIKDPSRWLIGVDAGATWYQVATGGNELYHYMLIGPDGSLLRCGNAGMFYTSGPDKDRFMLAADLEKRVQETKPTTILPADKGYQQLLKPVVRAVELRQFKTAWRLCRKTSGKDEDAAADELKTDLTDWATKRVEALTALLADEQATGEAKLDAYLELKQIAGGLSSTEPGKEARKLAADAARDKAVERELDARKDYLALMAKAVKAKDLAGNKGFASALKSLAKKHPDTRYGRMAETDAERIGG